MSEFRITFANILTNVTASEALYNFATAEHSEETLSFILDVINYRMVYQTSAADDHYALAQQVLKKYEPSSQYAIVWQGSEYKALTEELKKYQQKATTDVPLSLFDRKLQQEYSNLKGGMLSRFYQSQQYKQLIEQLTLDLALQLHGGSKQSAAAAPRKNSIGSPATGGKDGDSRLTQRRGSAIPTLVNGKTFHDTVNAVSTRTALIGTSKPTNGRSALHVQSRNAVDKSKGTTQRMTDEKVVHVKLAWDAAKQCVVLTLVGLTRLARFDSSSQLNNSSSIGGTDAVSRRQPSLTPSAVDTNLANSQSHNRGSSVSKRNTPPPIANAAPQGSPSQAGGGLKRSSTIAPGATLQHKLIAADSQSGKATSTNLPTTITGAVLQPHAPASGSTVAGAAQSTLRAPKIVSPVNFSSDCDPVGTLSPKRNTLNAKYLSPRRSSTFTGEQQSSIADAVAAGVKSVSEKRSAANSKKAADSDPTSPRVEVAAPAAAPPVLSITNKPPPPPMKTRAAATSASSDLVQRGYESFEKNPVGSLILRRFMQKEFSADNFDFVCAVDHMYRKCVTEDEIYHEAARIYHFYLDESSANEVTFPDTLRKPMKHALDTHTVTIHIFDDVRKEVRKTCKTDIFRRFVQSPIYKRIAADLKDRYDKHQRQLFAPFQQPPTPTAGQQPRGSLSQPHTDPERALTTVLNHIPIIPFHSVLEDPELLQSYIAFCTHEHSDENILFWLCVEEFKQNSQLEEVREYLGYWAEHIYHQFIVGGSEFEIPVPPKVRKEVESQLKFPHPQMFDVLQQQIYGLLQGDSGLRYLKSQDYVNVILKRVPDVQRKKLLAGEMKLDVIPAYQHIAVNLGNHSTDVDTSPIQSPTTAKAGSRRGSIFSPGKEKEKRQTL